MCTSGTFVFNNFLSCVQRVVPSPSLSRCTEDSDPPSPIAVFGFILLLGIVGFIFTNMAFYMWKKRLPFWVKNALCGCECSCEEKKKSDKKKKDSML